MKSLSYITVAALITIIMLLIYAGLQQVYRTGLNDPQVQLVQDVCTQLETGKQVSEIIPGSAFDISRSIAPFITLYDAQGKPLRSNGLLNGQMPMLPQGVFEEVKKNGEYEVSWQPRSAVRMAMVINKVNGGVVQYVASGRSMQQVEKRIGNMSLMFFMAWLACIAVLVVNSILAGFISRK